MTNNTQQLVQDFGFGGDEFKGELSTIPYAQFLNASAKEYGIAITSANAELAGFELIDSWHSIEHEFRDGSQEVLFITSQPKILVLNRSQPMMSNEHETIPYDKVKCREEEYKAFSYAVVWFLSQDNQPISELPFRLKCSGYAGLTFLQNYDYYNNPNSFCKQFLTTYKSLTGDKAIDKNEIFYAHAAAGAARRSEGTAANSSSHAPTLVRKKATSSSNGQSSFAVMTDSFTEPNKDNFAQLIVKNGSDISHKVKEHHQNTKSWLKGELLQQSAAQHFGIPLS